MARLKFGDSLVIRQTAKLKSPPNKPRIRYVIMCIHIVTQCHDNSGVNLYVDHFIAQTTNIVRTYVLIYS